MISLKLNLKATEPSVDKIYYEIAGMLVAISKNEQKYIQT